ncbi:hypothetical protein LCGC14_2214940 [marine sediment metagenome]|uniref:Uncharacterized protein n=1 Tax=marine sediment metagenome TaxID=412755 RepID=A0A0F9FQB7_9ZZZZ
MTELTLKEADELLPALCELAAIPMPAKASYRVGKWFKKIQDESLAFNEARNKLIRSLGHQIDDTDQWKVGDDKLPAFRDQINDLAEESVDLTGLQKIDFSDIIGINITPASLILLEPIIDGME